MARPRKAHALNIPARAVEEATALVREDARATVSMAEVARRIGCSAPALYAHFRDREDLLNATRAAAFAAMAARKVAHYGADSGDPLARLRDGGRSLVAFARANPGLYRLLYAPEMPSSAEAPAVPEAALAALASGIEAAQRVGFAAGVPADEVALTLWFLVHGAIMMALDGQLQGPEAMRWARAEDAVDTAMRLLGPQSESRFHKR